MSIANLLTPNNLDIYCRSYSGGGDHPSGTSIQIGPNSSASGAGSIAIGSTAVASGASAIAIGDNSTATGANSLALGVFSVAPADYDISIGNTAGGADTAESGIISLNGIPAPVASVTAVTRSISVGINGVQYYLKASTIA